MVVVAEALNYVVGYRRFFIVAKYMHSHKHGIFPALFTLLMPAYVIQAYEAQANEVSNIDRYVLINLLLLPVAFYGGL